MSRVAEGDLSALGELYDRHASGLLRFAARMATSNDAEDVVHEVFLRVVRLAKEFDLGAASVKDNDFDFDGGSTLGMAREGTAEIYDGLDRVARPCDHEPGEYAAGVRLAREAFESGDLFEVVTGQTFFEPCREPPSKIFQRLCKRNPSPYGAAAN